MTPDEVQSTLEQLHAELLRLGPLDEEAQAKVDALAASIQAAMDEPDHNQRSVLLADPVDEAIVALDVSHPLITAALRQLTSALNSMGL